MRRVVVVGASGSGKSTTARQLAARLDVPALDLDELFHGPDWAPTPTPQFRMRVMEALATAERTNGGWVVAGNYTTVMDIVHGAADTIVWLDLHRVRSWWRVTRRSVRRAATGEELWGGNRERWRNLVSADPEVNMIIWGWVSQPKIRARYEDFATGPFWSHAAVHRLTTPHEVRCFVAAS